MTDKEYTNYDLRFDWKINKEGNSGVFIDVQERPDIPARETRAGAWNESRMVQKDGHVEFYLNGVLTTQQDFRSSAWTDSIAKTRFNTYPESGKHVSGHIALQDWFKAVSFKNIRIREL